MNITSKQWFHIISGIVSGLITGAALLTTLFGQDLTIKIVAGLGILNIVISSVGTTLSGQAALVKDVAAMPGVDPFDVNAGANTTLAALAVDPKVDKIAPTQSAIDKVTQTAKGV